VPRAKGESSRVASDRPQHGPGLSRKRYPEAFAYVEDHFGRKLHAQNLVMAKAMVDLAHEKRSPHDALDALLTRLRAAM
jgi:hypothetical protein